MDVRAIGLAAGVLLSCSIAGPAFACANVAIVLAIDASGSVDDREYALQNKGLADALRDAEVHAAISRAGVVAISAVYWADSAFPIQRTGWTVLHSSEDARDLAGVFDRHRRELGGSTELARGLSAALDMFTQPGGCAVRQIVNLVGDGRETLMPRRRNSVTLTQVKRQAEQAGVTVNGLAISIADPGLVQYYQRHVMTGMGSFVMEVTDISRFSNAIIRKLIREIDPPLMARARMEIGAPAVSFKRHTGRRVSSDPLI